MTTTVAVTNGIGVQTGRLFACDAVSTVTLTGMDSAYNSAALAGRITTRDGRTALAATASATQASGAASFAFAFNTAACRALFATGAETAQTVRRRVIVAATDAVVADALMTMVPGIDAATIQVPT
jgi:hypothetical protein